MNNNPDSKQMFGESTQCSESKIDAELGSQGMLDLDSKQKNEFFKKFDQQFGFSS